MGGPSLLSVLFGLFALVHLTALVLAVLLWRRSGQHAFGLLVLVTAALTWDNTIIACGRLIGAGELLQALSIPRYVGHAFFTPLLIPLCVALAAQLGLSAFAKRWVVAAFGVLAIALIAVGVSTDVIALRLEPKAYADTLRYVNAAAAGPPVPAVVTIWVLIAIGLAIWVKARWAWLFVGAVAMFVAAAVGVSLVWLQNLGEVTLIVSVAATAVAIPTRRGPCGPRPPSGDAARQDLVSG